MRRTRLLGGVLDEPVSKILLSVSECAQALGVHRATVYDLLARGDLASVRIGRRRLIAQRTLEEFVAARERAGL